MSDDKPFATHSDRCVYVYGYIINFRNGIDPSNVANAAKIINDQVTARERKAAAQALREAADTVLDTHDGPAFRMIGSMDDGTENRRMFRDWLRAYADSVEKATP